MGESTRVISQEVLESLRHLLSIYFKVYANGDDIEDTQENVAAVKYAKNSPKLKHLSFHQFLQVSFPHRALKTECERLMLKYFSLLRIRHFLHDNYSLDVLANLEQFPLDSDDS